MPTRAETPTAGRPGVSPAWRTLAFALLAGIVGYAALNRGGWSPPLPAVADPVRQVSPPPPPVDPRLGRVLPAVDFDRVPLADAVARLAAAGDHLTVICAWDGLRPNVPLQAVPVTVHLRRATVGQAFDTTLAAAGQALGWIERDGVVTVCDKGAADASRAVTREYDVRPVLRRIAAGMGLFGPQAEENLNQCFPVPGVAPTLSVSLALDEVKNVIQQQVDPNSWKDNGGEVGSIGPSVIAGRLLICQTPAAHVAVERLLADLADSWPPHGEPR